MDAANLNLFEVEEEDDGGSSGGVIWCPHAILDDDGKLCWSGRRYATGCCSQTITVFQRQAMLTSRSPTVRARMGTCHFPRIPSRHHVLSAWKKSGFGRQSLWRAVH